jgi:hypothetical protein
MWDINPASADRSSRTGSGSMARARYNVASQYVAGLFYNRNENNPERVDLRFRYEPSRHQQFTQPGLPGSPHMAGHPEAQDRWDLLSDQLLFLSACGRRHGGRGRQSGRVSLPPVFPGRLDAPMTSRLLVETGALYTRRKATSCPGPTIAPTTNPQHVRRSSIPSMIGVLEQSTGLNYRAPGPQRILPQHMWSGRATMSYHHRRPCASRSA